MCVFVGLLNEYAQVGETHYGYRLVFLFVFCRMLAKKYSLELVASEIFSPQLKTLYRNHLKDHYASLAKYLERQHKDLQNMERQNRRTLQVCFDCVSYLGLKGSLTPLHNIVGAMKRNKIIVTWSD